MEAVADAEVMGVARAVVAAAEAVAAAAKDGAEYCAQMAR